MKTYIESIEDVSGKPYDYVADFIQEEVTGLQADAESAAIARENGSLTYIRRKHICKHEEGQPCTIEVI